MRKSLAYLIFRTVQLDLQFLCIEYGLAQKLVFLWAKYSALAVNAFSGFRHGSSHAAWRGKSYYFDDKFGLGYLQCLYVDEAFLRHYIPEGATIVDIGANVGTFNVFARDYLKASKVLSFEPVPNTYSLLERNSPGPNYNLAITTLDHLDLYLAESSGSTSIINNEMNEGQERIRVPGAVLDAIPDVQELSRIDLVKIDTEGAELDTLKASLGTLTKADYLLIEVSFARPAIGDVLDVFSFLRTHFPYSRVVRVGTIYPEKIDSGIGDVLVRLRPS